MTPKRMLWWLLFMVGMAGMNALVLAQHFEQGKEPQRALECFGRAAEQALEGNDIAEAIARASRAMSSSEIPRGGPIW